MGDFKSFLQTRGISKFITLIILMIILYSIGSLIHILLFTFLFAFLMGRLQQIITKQLDKVIKISPKIILIILYATVVTALGLVLYKYLPIITIQISGLVMELKRFFLNPPEGEIISFIMSSITDIPLNLDNGTEKIIAYISGVSAKALQIMIAIILSLFLLLESEKIGQFTSKFKYGHFGSFFLNLEEFGRKFINSFGKVIEVQFLIATTNAVITTIGLYLLDFPQLIGLSIMVFFLGLIPVAGAIISLIPLSMIGYNIGGFTTVLLLLVMIMVVHAIEAYILNPKFMSVKTNLPTFFTLTVLLLGEHFMGVWGLIIGIPIFIFILDMLEIPDDVQIEENKVNH